MAKNAYISRYKTPDLPFDKTSPDPSLPLTAYMQCWSICLWFPPEMQIDALQGSYE